MRNQKFTLALLGIILLTVFCASANANTVRWTTGGKQVYLVRKADNFIVLYDRSGSMAEKYADTIMTKIQAERKILLEKNATLPDMDWQAGIYSFTPDTQLTNLVEHYPMQQYDKKMFSWRLIKMPLEPAGSTMLQPGLMELDKILATLTGKTVIFLFTDGQYTQKGTLASPKALARKITSSHDACFVVMDTGASADEIATIDALASASECSYKVPFENLLGNPEWMTNALFDVVEVESSESTEMDNPFGEDAIRGYVWDNTLFDFDKATIRREFRDSLQEAGEFLRNNPDTRIVLEGHTDNVGSRDYNMKLSHKRAAAVRDYLIRDEGIDPARITLSGFGFSAPVASNDTETGRALNRRVQGIITGI